MLDYRVELRLQLQPVVGAAGVGEPEAGAGARGAEQAGQIGRHRAAGDRLQSDTVQQRIAAALELGERQNRRPAASAGIDNAQRALQDDAPLLRRDRLLDEPGTPERQAFVFGAAKPLPTLVVQRAYLLFELVARTAAR